MSDGWGPLPDGITPPWRQRHFEGKVPPPDMCWNCGLEVRELYRLTTVNRRLNKGIWYHVENEGRLCDPDSPSGSRGPKAAPKLF